MIFQLIYTCALTNSVDNESLKSIANLSGKRNLERDITGILLCKDGSVLQVLEGERSEVLSLYSKISADSRVTNALVLIQRPLKKREFPKWSMGYKAANDSDVAFELSAESFTNALPKDLSPEVDTIGRTFARVNGLA